MTKPLNTVPLRSPGRLGVNTDQASAVENHEWALVLDNAIINSADRIEARKGWELLTFVGNHGEDTSILHEYVKDSTTTYIISVADNVIYEGTSTLTDAEKDAAVPTGNSNLWQFINFNGKCLAWVQNEIPIIWDGSTPLGTNGFTDLTGTGTIPDGNAALATHGKIFAFDDDMITIRWCDTLDETQWSTGAAGNLNTANIWPIGLDIGVALAEWQNKLVIFGERSILIFDGLDDPNTNLQLSGTIADMITASGLAHRDAVCSTGTDLIYLSRSGLRTIRRAIEYESLPLTTIAPQIQRRLATDVDTAITNGDTIKLRYHQPLNAVLAKIGTKYWYFDVRDPDRIRASEWKGNAWKDALSADGTLYFGQNDGVAHYSSYKDSAASYSFEYKSPWVPLYEASNGQRFIPKRALVYLASEVTYTVTMSWAWDYENQSTSDSQILDTLTAAEWATAEWGIGEWGPLNTLVVQPYNLSGAGALVQVGIQVPINGGAFSLQQIDLLGKYGRLQR